METLPLLLDPPEAIDYFNSKPTPTDAEKAYIVGILSSFGYSNRAIRQALNIEHVYTVTHLKRAGTLLSEIELNLWHNNPKRITLGHVRAIAKLPIQKREALLRDLLIKKTPVGVLESLAQGREAKTADVNIRQFEQSISEHLGRPIKIEFNSKHKSGKLSLEFYGLDDLHGISERLGYNPEEQW